jgi:hypothetical protein
MAACSAGARPSSPSPAGADQRPGGGTPHAVSDKSPTLPRPSPTAQAWGSCGNIRDVADARSLVAAGAATALVDAQVSGAVVKSYRVLAGNVAGFRTLNDHLAAPRERYLLLLGGTSPDYYAAFVYYGVYRIAGEHAYQMCAYGAPEGNTRWCHRTRRHRRAASPRTTRVKQLAQGPPAPGA